MMSIVAWILFAIVALFVGLVLFLVFGLKLLDSDGCTFDHYGNDLKS